MCSFCPFSEAIKLARGTTATTENEAPAGFQHLVHPQAWSKAICPSIRILTGSWAHLQTNVPPLKFADAVFNPESTDG